MKKKLIGAGLALSLVTAGVALADDGGDDCGFWCWISFGFLWDT